MWGLYVGLAVLIVICLPLVVLAIAITQLLGEGVADDE